jgi:hypothetical protein
MTVETVAKANLTIKLDKALIREARVLAAERGTSISALVAAKLEEAVRERKGYEEAKKHALSILRERRPLHWDRPKSRDELHER